jgi:predicted nucleic acid-binding protein
LLSGLITPNGISARLIDAWLDRRFTLVGHPVQLEEFRAVSRRDKMRTFVCPS